MQCHIEWVPVHRSDSPLRHFPMFAEDKLWLSMRSGQSSQRRTVNSAHQRLSLSQTPLGVNVEPGTNKRWVLDTAMRAMSQSPAAGSQVQV